MAGGAGGTSGTILDSEGEKLFMRSDISFVSVSLAVIRRNAERTTGQLLAKAASQRTPMRPPSKREATFCLTLLMLIIRVMATPLMASIAVTLLASIRLSGSVTNALLLMPRRNAKTYLLKWKKFQKKPPRPNHLKFVEML